jgi:hypothetical protein
MNRFRACSQGAFSILNRCKIQAHELLWADLKNSVWKPVESNKINELSFEAGSTCLDESFPSQVPRKKFHASCMH